MAKRLSLIAVLALGISPVSLCADTPVSLPHFDSKPAAPTQNHSVIDFEALAKPVSLKLSDQQSIELPQPQEKESPTKWLRFTGDSASHAATADETCPLHSAPTLYSRNERLKKGRFYGIVRPRKRCTLFVGAFKYLWWRSQMTDGGLFCGSGIDF